MSIQFINQWKQLLHLKNINWVTFDLIEIEFEFDKNTGFELLFIVFGIGFRFSIVRLSEEMRNKIAKYEKKRLTENQS